MTQPKNNIISINRRNMPVEDYRGLDYKVVLVEGDIGDYAAYIGSGSDEFVARSGNKISFEEAQVHFPVGLEKEKYRY